MQNEAFFSQILDLSSTATAKQVILRDLQRNPANDKVMHIDLLRVRADRPFRSACRCTSSTKTGVSASVWVAARFRTC